MSRIYRGNGPFRAGSPFGYDTRGLFAESTHLSYFGKTGFPRICEMSCGFGGQKVWFVTEKRSRDPKISFRLVWRQASSKTKTYENKNSAAKTVYSKYRDALNSDLAREDGKFEIEETSSEDAEFEESITKAAAINEWDYLTSGSSIDEVLLPR